MVWTLIKTQRFQLKNREFITLKFSSVCLGPSVDLREHQQFENQSHSLNFQRLLCLLSLRLAAMLQRLGRSQALQRLKYWSR